MYVYIAHLFTNLFNMCKVYGFVEVLRSPPAGACARSLFTCLWLIIWRIIHEVWAVHSHIQNLARAENRNPRNAFRYLPLTGAYQAVFPWFTCSTVSFHNFKSQNSNWASQILKTNMLLMCPYCLKFQIARVQAAKTNMTFWKLTVISSKYVHVRSKSAHVFAAHYTAYYSRSMCGLLICVLFIINIINHALIVIAFKLYYYKPCANT